MSLTAGFDVVTELSGAAVLELILKQVHLAGVPIRPPFEFTVKFSGNVTGTFPGITVTGTFHAIVDDVKLSLDPATESATLSFEYSNASVLSSNPVFKLLTLDGHFTINVSIGLAAPEPGLMSLNADFESAMVVFQFSPQATQKVGGSHTGITGEQLAHFLGAKIHNEVSGLGKQYIGNGFRVTPPGVNGSLTPLVYTTLVRHCIVDSQTNQQAIGLFGNLLVANAGNGNPQLKTRLGITVGNNICLSIAPEAFHVLVFCPAMAKKLADSFTAFTITLPLAAMPPTCGQTIGFPMPGGVTLTTIADSFASGHINLYGSFKKSAECYEATGTFHGALTFGLSGGMLIPNMTMEPPEVDVIVSWYCVPAGVIFGPGLMHLISLAIGNAVIDAVAESLAEEEVDNILGEPLAPQNIGISGVTFNAAAITTEGLALNGIATIYLPLPGNQGLQLTGSVTTSSSEVLSSGTTMALAPMCPPKEFPFTEYAQQQVGTYTAFPKLLGTPLVLTWWILAGDGETKVALDGVSGNVSFPAQTFFPMPLPGGSLVDHQIVHLAFTKSANTIQLTNVPAEGNYQFALYVRATDPAGNTREISTPGQHVLIEGNTVVLGGGYQDYAALCAAKFAEVIHKFRPRVDLNFTPSVPVNYPSPEVLLDHIRTIVMSGDPRADDALAQIKMAHGDSFYRALLSPQAKSVGLSKQTMAGKSTIRSGQ